jgi:hypothetical protein
VFLERISSKDILPLPLIPVSDTVDWKRNVVSKKTQTGGDAQMKNVHPFMHFPWGKEPIAHPAWKGDAATDTANAEPDKMRACSTNPAAGKQQGSPPTGELRHAIHHAQPTVF